jgi:hypothetical protein
MPWPVVRHACARNFCAIAPHVPYARRTRGLRCGTRSSIAISHKMISAIPLAPLSMPLSFLFLLTVTGASAQQKALARQDPMSVLRDVNIAFLGKGESFLGGRMQLFRISVWYSFFFCKP